MNKWFFALALVSGLCQARAEGIHWPDHHLLPAFSSPAPMIDCIDVSSASGAEIDLFTSLQGIVNRTQPRIACLSRADREGKLTWLNLHHLRYHRINGYRALLKYRTNVTGLVVTDPRQPATLNLATTIAGVKNELICAPNLLATLTNAPYDFPVHDDLRGRFANAYQAYEWLYTHYWPRCTHRLIAGMEPGFHGGLRDYLVATKTATVWLNPGPHHDKDRSILGKFLAGLPAVGGVYLGWWPSEANGLNWIARYGIPVLGSDFLRNASLFSGVSQTIRIPAIPPPPPLENKVYVALILSDGDVIQYTQHDMKLRWADPARGTIPIGWTISPLAADMDPAMLEYYWSTATRNDCLISGPSGAGYTHMERWNAAHLTAYARVSGLYLQRSGLRVVTIWNRVTPAIARAFATNCPTLLGLTDQSGGAHVSANDGLYTIGLATGYSTSVNDMVSSITNAARNWNGRTPLFLAAQADTWHLTPTDLSQVASALNTNKYVLVRPDQLFMLCKQFATRPNGSGTRHQDHAPISALPER